MRAGQEGGRRRTKESRYESRKGHRKHERREEHALAQDPSDGRSGPAKAQEKLLPSGQMVRFARWGKSISKYEFHIPAHCIPRASLLCLSGSLEDFSGQAYQHRYYAKEPRHLVVNRLTTVVFALETGPARAPLETCGLTNMHTLRYLLLRPPSQPSRTSIQTSLCKIVDIRGTGLPFHRRSCKPC